jgi:hypothetical protein
MVGAGGWLGSLVLVVAAGIPAALRLPDGEPGPAVAELVNAFSPAALLFAGLVSATGVFSAWIHLEAFSALGRRLVWSPPSSQARDRVRGCRHRCVQLASCQTRARHRRSYRTGSSLSGSRAHDWRNGVGRYGCSCRDAAATERIQRAVDAVASSGIAISSRPAVTIRSRDA